MTSKMKERYKKSGNIGCSKFFLYANSHYGKRSSSRRRSHTSELLEQRGVGTGKGRYFGRSPLLRSDDDVPANVSSLSQSEEWRNGCASNMLSYKQSGRGIGPKPSERAGESASQTLRTKDETHGEPMEVEFDSTPDSFLEANNVNGPSAMTAEKWMANTDSEGSSYVQETHGLPREEEAYQLRPAEFMRDVDMPSRVIPTGDILIIIDTNIFISHLDFLKKLLTSRISMFKHHVLLAPWAVIQELDLLMKKKDAKLSAGARFANKFVYDCLVQRNPTFFGQSYDDYNSNFTNNERVLSTDDFLHRYLGGINRRQKSVCEMHV